MKYKSNVSCFILLTGRVRGTPGVDKREDKLETPGLHVPPASVHIQNGGSGDNPDRAGVIVV